MVSSRAAKAKKGRALPGSEVPEPVFGGCGACFVGVAVAVFVAVAVEVEVAVAVFVAMAV